MHVMQSSGLQRHVLLTLVSSGGCHRLCEHAIQASKLSVTDASCGPFAFESVVASVHHTGEMVAACRPINYVHDIAGSSPWHASTKDAHRFKVCASALDIDCRDRQTMCLD